MPSSKRARPDDVISINSSTEDDFDTDGVGVPPARRVKQTRASGTRPSRPAVERAKGSAELDVPHTLDDASRTQLHVAIATTSEERVREAFAALVDSLPAVTERVFQMLVAARPVAPGEREQEELGEAGAAGSSRALSQQHQARERVVMGPRWLVCANCREEYDAGAEWQPDECSYHSELEANYDAFVDWDEDVHGEIDTRENRRSYPENFIWTCCDRDGTQPGCVSAEHEPGEGRVGRKRARRY
ncbi:hypothetical protein GY45DRAFT_920959 [Cubamyces sp. BRFM 1775]|nr:hypothetical protein GY45DRAFT_920959 [Cubamyces sp. BRFM 1775]